MFNPNDPDQLRIDPMRETFDLISHIIQNKSWYDFGCGYGTSSLMLYEFGASKVLSFEPDTHRFHNCPKSLNVVNNDTAENFDNVFSYGVFEHVYIEQRQSILQSLWERLNIGGLLVIADTPNRLLPYDHHTTNLPLIPWLPENLAKYFAEKSRRRWDWGNWRSCGFRGLWLGDFKRLSGKVSFSPINRSRHKLLSSFGLHPHLVDPWPVWVWQKNS